MKIPEFGAPVQGLLEALMGATAPVGIKLTTHALYASYKLSLEKGLILMHRQVGR